MAWNEDRTFGDKAEQIVEMLRPLLTERAAYIFPFHNKNKKEEGGDRIVIQDTRKDENAESDIRTGGQEIKGIRSFLSRDNDGKISCGTLYFELLNNAGDEQGSLYAMLFPDLWNEAQRQSGSDRCARRPLELFFVLFSGDDDKVFCTIAFENVEALFKKLGELAALWGWNMFDPESWSPENIKEFYSDAQKKNERKRNRQYIIKGKDTAYNWHVPLDEIIDLATVTVIGEKPETPEEYEQARYEFLVTGSKGRIISEEELEKIRQGFRAVKKKAKGHNVYAFDERPFK